ncbi:NAD-dependent epimerase/dehydratase family protein [Flavobacterium pallidum]|uniref:NAD-dependent epimerase n=1 Tax=Flavobacterium pallidum TaxID=2172098 RepID=A0A2S1SEK6_9FLAO|nr:NAD-dependent epimerase/dehydratase family protein [Flavobacterium pallidum]AWI24821.1 NAD-dependent epimerase [Flavobacterium pallidum]
MILVTGGTGLVGMHLLMLLAEKEEAVLAIYRNTEGIEKVKRLFEMQHKADSFHKIEWQQADITDIPSLENVFSGISKVYHCAAMISFDQSDEGILRKVNIEGTANIVNFCLAKEVQKLCFVSSIAALGDVAVNETVISEETEWNPEKYHSDYAISKYGAEMEVWRGQQEGLETVIVNPGVIIGPFASKADWQNGSGRIFWEISKGMKYYTKGATGFVGVWDVAAIMHQLMESPIQSQRFALVSEIMSFEVLSKMIAHEIGVKAPTVYAKKWMTEWAWRIDGVLSFLFFKNRKLSKAAAKSLHALEQYDNSKVRQALHFDFESIPAVINKTAVFFRKT